MFSLTTTSQVFFRVHRHPCDDPCSYHSFILRLNVPGERNERGSGYHGSRDGFGLDRLFFCGLRRALVGEDSL